MASRRANTVAGRLQWIEPWSVVSSTRTPRRAASFSALRAAERSNQVRVSERRAAASRATSRINRDSLRP